MIKYISKRLLMMIPVLLGVILLVFIVMNLASGNAVMLILGWTSHFWSATQIM